VAPSPSTTPKFQTYDVEVDPGTTSLHAEIGSPSDVGADLDLFVFDCTSGTCVLADFDADGDSEEAVTIDDPAAGLWIVAVDGYAVPSGTTEYSYLDVFANPAFGPVEVDDANALRPAGETWTVEADITPQQAPAETGPSTLVQPGCVATARMAGGECRRTEPIACAPMTPAPDDDGTDGGGPFDELLAERRAKLQRLRDAGIDPYPVGVRVTDALADVNAAWDQRLEAGEESQHSVAVGGRLVARRGHGKLVFLVLREGDAELQAMAQIDVLGAEAMARVADLDVGDWVAVTGMVVRTRRGELSVKADEVTLIGKSLRPLPDKWHGLRDTETRFRRREVDLIVNAEARRVFAIRASVIRSLRAELDERGYVEVETPLLHTLPGGALGRPFVTHHNALDMPLYLRIAEELHLKRLVAGGMSRVYEIGRVFRNEGLSPRHNPEFTLLESYQAYADYRDIMALTQALVRRAALESVGTTALTYGGRPLELGGDWPRRTLLDLVREATGRDDLDYDLPVGDLRRLCAEHGVPTEDAWGTGKLVLELYEKLVEHTLWDPTFVTDHPVEVSPLARRHRDDPRVTERFEPIVAGRELGNAFSELTDPIDQRQRFEAQALARIAGDSEAMSVDSDYLRAMELGMPPMGGLGIGVDRLVMLLADVSTIRDVILFPTLRPEPQSTGGSEPGAYG
jgi:lysyl-tRNA synthetase class 2